MLTREELEKMIENGETVWYFDAEDEADWGIVEIDTKNFRWSDSEDCYINFNKETWQTDPQPYKMYNDSLYKTKEEAEWVANMHATREEKFCPPTWEEMQEDLKDVPDGTYTVIENSQITLDYKKSFIIDEILLYGIGADFNWNATKENYTKAVELAKRLFLREDK